MLITEKFEENDKGAEFPIAEESVPDIGSLLANRLIDTIIEPGYNKYLDICSNLSDLKAIIALQNINKYLSEYGIEKQFNVDSGSGSLRQFILMLKEEDASMYEAAYKYFDKKLMHEKAETALKKGLSMPLVRIDFWKLAGRRIKDLMEKKNYNEVFNLCNVLNSITDLPREYSTKLLEQQVLAMEAEGSLLEQQGLAKEVAAKFLRVTGTYLKLMERTSGKPEYWAGLHNALCIIYNNHMEKIHKTSSHTFNKVVDAINYLHKHTISNLEIKDIAYDIFLMGGSLNQGEGAYDKAMKLYSDAIKINPKRKEAWDAKLLILDDRNSIYYGPASYKKNRLIKLRNEIFAS
jgi:tetratricopeptide (TPR) repeat protein